MLGENNSYVDLLLAVLESHGCDTSEVSFINRDGYADGGRAEDFRDNPEYINFDCFSRTIERDDWGLIFGENNHLQALGPFGYAVLSAPTLLHSLKLIIRFTSLNAWYFTFRLHKRADFYQLTFRPNRSLYNLENGLTDLIFFMLCDQIYNLYPLAKAQVELNFCGPKRTYIDRLRKDFPGSIHFNQRTNGVKIPAEMCEARSKFHDEYIWEYALQRCKKHATMKQYLATDDPVELVQKIIDAAIEDNYAQRPACVPLPDIEAVARKVEQSEFALRQSLRAHGFQYRKIKEERRRKAVLRLLTDESLTIQSIGFILGYHDASNFTRTCTGWFGKTPKQLRKQLLEEQKGN